MLDIIRPVASLFQIHGDVSIHLRCRVTPYRWIRQERTAVTAGARFFRLVFSRSPPWQNMSVNVVSRS